MIANIASIIIHQSLSWNPNFHYFIDLKFHNCPISIIQTGHFNIYLFYTLFDCRIEETEKDYTIKKQKELVAFQREELKELRGRCELRLDQCALTPQQITAFRTVQSYLIWLFYSIKYRRRSIRISKSSSDLASLIHQLNKNMLKSINNILPNLGY